MKNILKLLVLSVVLFTAACKQDDVPALSGTTSDPNFTYTVSQKPGGDTLPFTNIVSFTNTTTDAFAYFWDFGDNGKSTDMNPTHAYTTSGDFIVKLISLGKAGNNNIVQTVSITNGPCNFAQFNGLTGCSSRTWKLSPVNDAIKFIADDGITVLSTSAAVACQLDDSYEFNINGTVKYLSGGQTFIGNEASNANSCQPTQANAKQYFMLKNAGGRPKIVLTDTAFTRTPFFGATDAVVGNTYEIVSVDDNDMVIQGALVAGGFIQMKFNNSLSPNTVKLTLHGGSRKTWMFDTTAGANAVTAGVESNPTQYYAGGPLAPCQKDDWYTFTSTDSVYVNLNGGTLLPSAGFSCGPSPDEALKFTYANSRFTIPVGSAWIGVLDRAPENVYRILYIDNEKMTIRSGDGTGTVHDFKFVIKR